jgi:hypothetical protein
MGSLGERPMFIHAVTRYPGAMMARRVGGEEASSVKTFNSAAVLERPAKTPAVETYPRYVATDTKGGEYLLAADMTPLWRRPSRERGGEPADPAMGLPRIVSQRDLWIGGSSPAHDPASGWEVREIMRRWALWPEG